MLTIISRGDKLGNITTMFHGLNIMPFRQAKGVCALVILTLSVAGCGSSDTHTAAGSDDVTPVVNADPSQGPLNKNTASATVDASKTSNSEFDPDSFTTEGKPTKTIETPWGPREVYDPTQVPEIREDFRIWYNHPESITFSKHTVEMFNFYNENPKHKYRRQIIVDARRIQALDYARHQCMRQTYWAGCSEEDFVFKEPCLTDHNLHSKDLSKCEGESMAYLSKSSNKCTLKSLPSYFEVLRELPFEDALYSHYARVCDVWRGQPGHNYWEKELPDRSRLRNSRTLLPRNARKKIKFIHRKK